MSTLMVFPSNPYPIQLLLRCPYFHVQKDKNYSLPWRHSGNKNREDERNFVMLLLAHLICMATCNIQNWLQNKCQSCRPLLLCWFWQSDSSGQDSGELCIFTKLLLICTSRGSPAIPNIIIIVLSNDSVLQAAKALHLHSLRSFQIIWSWTSVKKKFFKWNNTFHIVIKYTHTHTYETSFENHISLYYSWCNLIFWFYFFLFYSIFIVSVKFFRDPQMRLSLHIDKHTQPHWIVIYYFSYWTVIFTARAP